MIRPKNIKLTVSCLPNCEAEIKTMFYKILEDYCKRFTVKVTERKLKLSICLVEYDAESQSEGLTTICDDEDKILIQLRDPFMNDWEPNPYTIAMFLTVLAHEMIHACQFITGRTGFKIPKFVWDKNDYREQYYFDPMEVEARVLEAPYAQLYGKI